MCVTTEPLRGTRRGTSRIQWKSGNREEGSGHSDRRCASPPYHIPNGVSRSHRHRIDESVGFVCQRIHCYNGVNLQFASQKAKDTVAEVCNLKLEKPNGARKSRDDLVKEK